jgi:hypothetical protein
MVAGCSAGNQKLKSIEVNFDTGRHTVVLNIILFENHENTNI